MIYFNFFCRVLLTIRSPFVFRSIAANLRINESPALWYQALQHARDRACKAQIPVVNFVVISSGPIHAHAVRLVFTVRPRFDR
jgi:hypothetical protein